jgi:hypothetical protein
MPGAMPAGIQPAMTSLAKSWPDMSVANGRATGGQPLALTAVPITELDGSGRETVCRDLPDLQRRPHDAVAAKICALAGHPVDRRPASVVQRLCDARDRAGDALPGHGGAAASWSLRRRGAFQLPASGPRAAHSCGGAEVVDGAPEYLAGRLEPDPPDRGEPADGQGGVPSHAPSHDGHQSLRRCSPVGHMRLPVVGRDCTPRPAA